MENIMWKRYKDPSARVCTSARGRVVQQGFTLVELAIVILILSLLLVVVFAVVNGIVKISTETSPVREAKRQAFFALQVLKSSIEQAYYRQNIKRLWFIGRKDGVNDYRKDRLTFAAVHPGASDIGASSVREVSFYLREKDDDVYALIRREDQLVDEEPGKGGAHYELLQNVLSLQLQYSRDAKDWLDEWDHHKTRRLPLAVLIDLKIKAGSKEYNFTAIAHPGINIK